MTREVSNKSGDLTAATVTNLVTLNTAGHGSVAAQLTGTWVGTVTWQGTVGDPSTGTYVSVSAANVATGAVATTATANGVYGIICPGFSAIRANCTAYTSGTVTVLLQAVLTSGTTNNVSVTSDTEFPTAAALNGTWAKTTVTTISGAAVMANDGTNEVLVGGDAANGLDVDVTRLPALVAGTNRIGGAYLVSGNIIDENGTSLTVKRAFANPAASATDSNIVTAVAAKKIRVLSVVALAGGTATNLTFNSKPAGAGTAISPLLANGANGGEVLPMNQYGWFETTSGEGLTVTTGAGSATGILVMYVEV